MPKSTWIGLGSCVLASVIGVSSSVWPEAIRPHPRIVIALGVCGLLCIIVPIIIAICQRIFPASSPLEIIFDPSNPSRRFWSMETVSNKAGSPIGVYWEHRVDVKNNSLKTLKNVKITTEHVGPMPVRPTNQVFDKIKQIACDLHPGCAELVPVIRWPIPKMQPGMVTGPTKMEYGPIRITASADNIPPCVKVFNFNFQTEQMLFPIGVDQ
jgi:hypothetical protein